MLYYTPAYPSNGLYVLDDNPVLVVYRLKHF